ncbi:DUF4189 domain-containing protein [Pseudoxanthomonas sp. X-1]|nr:DUF4189 domain-containing protein [Pseudoxanthomonas sp. X-1]
MNKFLLAAILFALPIEYVHAEGNCPPGYFPQSGPGWQGCAPGPGVNASGNAASRPGGYWQRTWGAVATSLNPPAGVTAKGFASKKEAIAAAVAACKQKGGGDCRSTFTYFNQCVAIAQGREQGVSMTSAAGSVERASELAMSGCQKDNAGHTCQVVVAECSEPYYQSY